MSKRYTVFVPLSPSEKITYARSQVILLFIYAFISLAAVSFSWVVCGDFWFLIPLAAVAVFFFTDARHYFDGLRYLRSLRREANLERV